MPLIQQKLAAKNIHFPNWRPNTNKNFDVYNATLSDFFTMDPSGAKLGAGNDSQSTSSQKSFDQSAVHTLTLRSALAASHNVGDDSE